MAEYWENLATRQDGELRELRYNLRAEKRRRRALQVVALIGWAIVVIVSVVEVAA